MTVNYVYLTLRGPALTVRLWGSIGKRASATTPKGLHSAGFQVQGYLSINRDNEDETKQT